MNEHSYIKAVTRHLSNDVYTWKINDTFAGGVPDMFIEGKANDLWVEWKYISPFPKRDKTMIDLTKPANLSILQQKWLIRRYNTRGDVCVVAGCEFGGVVLFGLDWQKPISAKAFKALCAKNKQVAHRLIKATNKPAN